MRYPGARRAGERHPQGERRQDQCTDDRRRSDGPVTPIADEILRDKGIFVIPDILANAGGVTVSYFEWVQDLQNYFWNEAEINNRLRQIMTASFHQVMRIADEKKIDNRTAAQVLGIGRVMEALQLRGLYP